MKQHDNIREFLRYGRTISVLLLLLLLSACSQTFDRQTCVSLPQDSRYCLAPLPNQTRSLTQKISIKVGTQQHELMGQLDLTPNSLTLVGLAPLGQPLFTLVYNGKSLSSKQSILLGKQFKAEYLMAMLQLIYWPQAEVNQYLQGAKLKSFSQQVPLCRSNNVNIQAGSITCKEGLQCNATLCKALYNTQKKPPATPILQIQYSQLDPWGSKVELSIPEADFTLTMTPIT
ncbi:DUF3261 domain-containing protein [Shewanella surugensis]|uniref:DUF3261 domain-containing protein n=1 Tax=Shewanella surugensis TaxID=212020 RepID=A0ABT0LA51_9GAMM|nr:DUF3261 domain-containing protein [Shewanella surugensis]MCL1124593.1 DUF3261 domain-containing protein [Shewanella surugensis]